MDGDVAMVDAIFEAHGVPVIVQPVVRGAFDAATGMRARNAEPRQLMGVLGPTRTIKPFQGTAYAEQVDVKVRASDLEALGIEVDENTQVRIVGRDAQSQWRTSTGGVDRLVNGLMLVLHTERKV